MTAHASTVILVSPDRVEQIAYETGATIHFGPTSASVRADGALYVARVTATGDGAA